MAPRPCIEPGCLDLAVATRCPSHQAALERLKRQRRPYTSAEKVRRARLVANWIATYGLVCPGCPWNEGRPHPVDPRTNPLTADHITPVAEGGPEDGPLRVLCRRGNSSRVSRSRTP